MIYAFDLESHLIKPGMSVPRGVCLSYAGEDGSEGVLLREEGMDWLHEKLLDPEVHFVAQNAPFDWSVAAADRPELLSSVFQAYYDGRCHDTIIRQKILDNATGELKFEYDPDLDERKRANFSLAHLVKRHLNKWIFGNKEGGDIWRLRYNELDGVPVEDWPKEAYDYALSDSIYARDIFFKQLEHPFSSLLEKEWTQTQADWALQLMSVWGVRTAPQEVAKLRALYEAEFEKWLDEARAHDLVYQKKEKGQIKWSRHMKAIHALVEKTYQGYDLKVPLTAKGQVSTDRETLTMRKYPQLEPHPGMTAIMNMVRTQKLLTTYLPILESGTQVPINPSYNAILETYRTSCRRPNLQNQSRDGGVRDCFIARPGYVFGFCDYDTLEMRTLAQICIDLFGESQIAEAVKEGKDLHLAFAADMLGIEYEEAEQRLEAGDKIIAEVRQGSKIANYGFGGGMGPDAFIDYARGFGMEITKERAVSLYQGFRSKWTEMVKYFDYCSKLVDEKDPQLGINQLTFPRSGLIRGDVRYTAMCNSHFQQLAAMGAKQACFAVSRECYTNKQSPLYNCRPWLFCHDEIGMEIPWDGTHAGNVRAHQAMMELERIMVESMQFYCPDVPIGASGAMAFKWYKGAKAVYRDGLMVPCRKEGKVWVEDTRELLAA